MNSFELQLRNWITNSCFTMKKLTMQKTNIVVFQSFKPNQIISVIDTLHVFLCNVRLQYIYSSFSIYIYSSIYIQFFFYRLSKIKLLQRTFFVNFFKRNLFKPFLGDRTDNMNNTCFDPKIKKLVRKAFFLSTLVQYKAPYWQAYFNWVLDPNIKSNIKKFQTIQKDFRFFLLYSFWIWVRTFELWISGLISMLRRPKD